MINKKLAIANGLAMALMGYCFKNEMLGIAGIIIFNIGICTKGDFPNE